MTKISKLELELNKKGYVVNKTEEKKSLDYLQNKVLSLGINVKPELKQKIKLYKKNEDFFQNIHKYVKKNELNDFRVKLIDGINKDAAFKENYYIVAKKLLHTLVGNELAMQSKINLSIQIPNDNSSMLPMHSDVYAGESPFEVVIWIPLTNVAASTHSMFITDPTSNKKINREITTSKKKTIIEIFNKYKKNFKFIKIAYGNVLLFTPVLMHGNVVNKTSISRLSLNCRFKSLLSPYDVFSKTHRNIPHFYKPLIIKPLTKIGFNFIKAVNENKYKINSKL